MKTITFFILMALSSFAVGQNIAGTWFSLGTYETPGGNSSNLVLLPDGFFHVQWDYKGGYVDPLYGWGAYSWDGKQLVLQYFDGSKQIYEIRNFNAKGFVMYYAAEGSSWDYTYKGAPVLEEWKKVRLRSESLFYQLTGQWVCNGETFKFLGDGAMFVVPQGSSSGTLYSYVTYDDELKIREITETGDNFIWSGKISDLSPKGMNITTGQGKYYYQFQGNVKLASSETILYTQYLNVIHRSSMTAIDGMDGVRDFIWKRVDKYGNERP
ncbi:MAG: hypothetical protein R3C61_22390 [Bacteroidia bacterium]